MLKEVKKDRYWVAGTTFTALKEREIIRSVNLDLSLA